MATQKKRFAAEMEKQRINYENQLYQTQVSLRQCQQKIVTLESTVIELNIVLEKKTDVEKQRDEWKAHHDSMEASKRELQIQLEGASTYITQLEEKYYESQTTQLEMLKQMKEYESEIETLRAYIIDLKSRM